MEVEFLQAIASHPGDDGPRLVYADWLSRHTDPAVRARAEFIRLQCALARHANDPSAVAPLRLRERELKLAHGHQWVAPIQALGAAEPQFCRGILDCVTISAARLHATVPRLMQAVPTLRQVRLTSLSLVQSDLSRWRPVASLKGLRLNQNRLKDALAKEWANSAVLDGIEVFSLAGNQLTDRGAESLSHSPHLDELRELDLSQNRIGPAGAAALSRSGHLRSLEVLRLSENRLGDRGLAALVGSGHLESVRHLALGSNQIGPEGAAALRHSSAMPTLEVVDLSGNRLGPEGALALNRWLTTDQLRRLDLSRNSLGDFGLVCLAGITSSSNGSSAEPESPQVPPPSGLELNLSWNQLGDQGIEALAYSPRWSHISVLDLRYNSVGDAGAVALAGSPYLNRLSRLLVHFNKIGSAGRNALLQRFGTAVRGLG